MRKTNRAGWIFAGVLIGALGSAALPKLSAFQEQPARRLIVVRTGASIDGYGATFIKDTKTGACWLSIRTRDDMGGALAPAPPASCEP